MSLWASIYMCFVVTCWERADLLALVCGVCCEFVTFPLVSWVRCGTWLYRFLIFAPLFTFIMISLKRVNDVTCLSMNGCSIFIFPMGWYQVCEINRIHHWCPVGTEKSQPEGPPFQWDTRLAEFPSERWTRGLGFFWNHGITMIDSFSYIPILKLATVPYGTE